MCDTKDVGFNENLIMPILKRVSKNIVYQITKIPIKRLLKIEEIRLGVDRPAIFYSGNESFYISENGQVTYDISETRPLSIREIQETFTLMCDNSVYSAQDDIKLGFITIEGGHRVGICGSCVIKENKVSFIKDVSAINIRVARQAVGAANNIIHDIVSEDIVKNTLIVSPPGCGKTTMLRDIARILGNGNEKISPKRVGIVDERGEIASVYRGVAQNDIGVRSVVLDACPKAEGMNMLLRSMGVDVIITDEIGSEEDKLAIANILNAGVSIIASAHGSNANDVENISHGFKKIIILSNRNRVGNVEEIINYDT